MRWPWQKPKRQRFAEARQEYIRRMRAKFDAAQTTAANRRHWANADSLSPDAAASPAMKAGHVIYFPLSKWTKS